MAHADVAEIEKIAVRMTEQVITEVTAYLDKRIAQAVAEIRQEHTAQEQRLDDLAATVRTSAAAVTEMIRSISTRTDPPDPAQHRPRAIDAACAADPDAGPQRVVVDVLGRSVTDYITPGSDPAQVWDAICNAVASHLTPEADAWQN